MWNNPNIFVLFLFDESILIVRNFMFTHRKHKFKGDEHKFKGDEHKFTGLEHKIYREEKKNRLGENV